MNDTERAILRRQETERRRQAQANLDAFTTRLEDEYTVGADMGFDVTLASNALNAARLLTERHSPDARNSALEAAVFTAIFDAWKRRQGGS